VAPFYSLLGIRCKYICINKVNIFLNFKGHKRLIQLWSNPPTSDNDHDMCYSHFCNGVRMRQFLLHNRVFLIITKSKLFGLHMPFGPDNLPAVANNHHQIGIQPGWLSLQMICCFQPICAGQAA
jgi:hypothetical protein